MDNMRLLRHWFGRNRQRRHDHVSTLPFRRVGEPKELPEPTH